MVLVCLKQRKKSVCYFKLGILDLSYEKLFLFQPQIQGVARKYRPVKIQETYKNQLKSRLKF